MSQGKTFTQIPTVFVSSLLWIYLLKTTITLNTLWGMVAYGLGIALAAGYSTYLKKPKNKS